MSAGSPIPDPERYWGDRLDRHRGSRGTGHISYSESYNRWLYRAKGRALSRALRQAGEPRQAIDIGSGTGWVVDQLASRGISANGCDLVPEAVERLRDRHPGSDFSVVRVGRDALPATDSSVDLVTALDVLYHVVDDAEWRFSLDEIRRVLEPSGFAIVTDGFGQTTDSPAPHVKFRSRESWKEALTKVQMTTVARIPLYRWLSRDREELWLPRAPDSLRGPAELALEYVAPRAPHLWMAVLGPVDQTTTTR